jgi:predicted ATP-dependent serine protease
MGHVETLERVYERPVSILATSHPTGEPVLEMNSASVFRPINLELLLDEPEEDIAWIIDGYLARGTLTLLAGPPKIGKTTLAYNLITAVANGQSVLKRTVLPAKVVVLALEEHRRDVVRRFREVREGLRETVKIYVGPLPFTETVLDEIVNFIEREKIGLVLVDTLHAWWGVSDENSAGEVLRTGGMLLNAVRRTSAAWLCLVHTRKSGGEHGQEIRGSTALLGLVDMALSMKRTEGAETQRCLEAVSRYAETPSRLIIALGDSGYEALGSPEDLSAQAKMDRIKATLTTIGQTAKELAQTSGFPEREVKRCLSNAGEAVIKAGAGVRRDPYRYSIPAASPSGDSTLLESNPRDDSFYLEGNVQE